MHGFVKFMSVSLVVAAIVAVGGCSSGDQPVDIIRTDFPMQDTANLEVHIYDTTMRDNNGDDAVDDEVVAPDAILDAVDDATSDPDTVVPDSVLPDAVDVTQPERLAITHFYPAVSQPGQLLAMTFQATGGTPPYSGWTVVKGALPDGTTLDPQTGVWSGLADTAGLYYFVVQVTDAAAATATELFAIRIGDPSTVGTLAARAQAFQDVYELRHDWQGFSFNNMTPDDPDGNLGLSTLGDATFQSGQCTMAMAYRDAVVRTAETSAYLKKQVDGWRFFQNLTGVPGLIGRSWGRADYPWEDNHHSDGFWPDNPDSRSYRGEGEYADYIWVGDVSRDQASGAVLGVAAAYDLADDPETKATAAAFLTDMMDHVWANNLDFMDKNEKLTRYGNVDGNVLEGWPYQNGLNSACALAWFKIAAHVAEMEGLDNAERFEERYQELLSRGYVDNMREFMWVYDGYVTKHYNTYMAYENMFHLARLEDDPVIGPQIDEVFRDTLWLNLDDKTPNRRGVKEGNPVKTTWYLYSTGDRDPIALWEALWQIAVFPEAPLRDRYVKNSDDPSIVKNPDRPEESLYPLPSNRLQPDMVIWHRSTFLLDGGSDSGEERTGCDYLLPYWMGRYYGWIHESW